MTLEIEDHDAPPEASVLAGLLPPLRRLDRLLERAAARVPAAYGAHVADDRFRGLYVGEADLEPLLARAPGDPAFGAAPDAARGDADRFRDEAPTEGSRLAWLAAEHALTAFDVDVLVLALACELDLRYERLYAYLQDDVTRRRPTVDLALNLFCASAAERLVRRAHFAPEAPLARARLVELAGDPSAPLLAQALALDEQVTGFLLGQDALDRRLAGACRLADAAHDDLLADDPRVRALGDAVREAWEAGEGLRVRLHGPRGAGKCRYAAAVAHAADVPMLLTDVAALLEPRAPRDAERALATVLREGRYRGALVVLRRGEALLADGGERVRERLEEMLAEHAGPVVLATSRPWPADSLADAIEVELAVPDAARRAALWREGAREAGGAILDAAAREVGARFRLTPRQIGAAAAAAARRAAWHARLESHASAAVIPAAELFAAAREQSRRELATLAPRVEPVHRWEELVLPADAVAQLREIARRVTHRERVMEEWGFGARLPRGRGINALFSGPSGTGKTMAADVLAGALGVDLYRVELSGVVSKYIGETEKNLDAIFAAAAGSNGIVFFDEADALFGKRSEVHDAHDRYANIEISYLLQKMEAFDGVAILATNLRGNLDGAFVRRLAFTVHFPFPDEASRLRIWRAVWPSAVPLGADVDLALLARQFALSGGNIRNVALAAAFLAAERGEPVAMRDLMAATRREYQKLGKTLVESELGAWREADGVGRPS
jgi:AAA+ superfamily predicted ATPase